MWLSVAAVSLFALYRSPEEMNGWCKWMNALSALFAAINARNSERRGLRAQARFLQMRSDLCDECVHNMRLTESHNDES